MQQDMNCKYKITIITCIGKIWKGKLLECSDTARMTLVCMSKVRWGDLYE